MRAKTSPVKKVIIEPTDKLGSYVLTEEQHIENLMNMCRFDGAKTPLGLDIRGNTIVVSNAIGKLTVEFKSFDIGLVNYQTLSTINHLAIYDRVLADLLFDRPIHPDKVRLFSQTYSNCLLIETITYQPCGEDSLRKIVINDLLTESN